MAAQTHVGSCVCPRRWPSPSARARTAPRCHRRRRGLRGRRGDRRAARRASPRAASARRPCSARSARPPRWRRCSDSTRDATAHAIAIGASFSGGTNQTWIDGSSEYRIQPGMAARNGIVAGGPGGRAASPARRTGTRARPGSPARSPDGDPQAGEPWELGERWRLLGVVYKPFPVCAITQSPVRVAIDMATDNDLDGRRRDRRPGVPEPGRPHLPRHGQPGPVQRHRREPDERRVLRGDGAEGAQRDARGLRGFEDPTSCGWSA